MYAYSFSVWVFVVIGHDPVFPVSLPFLQPGMRVGLYGGSFNPPHEGHRLVAQTALKRLELDRVWWIVTPGNPLKGTSELKPLEERMAACRQVAADPRITVTGFEQQLGTQYTIDALEYIDKRYPEVSFVWLMGADSLVSFHLWRGWRKIARLMPIAVIDRPKSTLKATQSSAAQFLKNYRLPSFQAKALMGRVPPCWVFLYGARSNMSSTLLRSQGK